MEPTCALCGHEITTERCFCSRQCRQASREVLRSLRARRRHLEGTSAAEDFGAGLGPGVFAFLHGIECALELNGLRERIRELEKALRPDGISQMLNPTPGPQPECLTGLTPREGAVAGNTVRLPA